MSKMTRYLNKNVLEEKKDTASSVETHSLKPGQNEEEYRRFCYMNRMYGMGGFDRIKSVKEHFTAIINYFTTPGYLYFLYLLKHGFNLKE